MQTHAEIIDITPENIAQYGVCGYKNAEKHLELRRKIEWFETYYPKGLRIKAVIDEKGGMQGMLEYIPGTLAHRPVNAAGYMFIHCVFVGFKKEYKGKGYASRLISSCIEESRAAGLNGVAVVTRKGSFMVNKDIFLKMNFVCVDKALPDFELLVLKFNSGSPDPVFLKNMPVAFSKGLHVLRSPQCPYSVKNVDAIMQTAASLKIDAHLTELSDHLAVQQSPCAFGTFSIIRNGVVLSHHPISNTRFTNILNDK